MSETKQILQLLKEIDKRLGRLEDREPDYEACAEMAWEVVNAKSGDLAEYVFEIAREEIHERAEDLVKDLVNYLGSQVDDWAGEFQSQLDNSQQAAGELAEAAKATRRDRRRIEAAVNGAKRQLQQRRRRAVVV